MSTLKVCLGGGRLDVIPEFNNMKTFGTKRDSNQYTPAFKRRHVASIYLLIQWFLSRLVRELFLNT